MYPSVKKIKEVLDISQEEAKIVRWLMDGTIPHDRITGKYIPHNIIERILEALDIFLGGFGVEYYKPDDSDEIIFQYVNMGDTYAPTVIYHEIKGKFMVCCWGDIVEAEGK